MTRDLLDPSDLTAEKFHHHAVQRPSTRKSAPAKTGASMDRSGDLSAHKPRSRDPYLPKAQDVSGYDQRLQDAIRAFAAADRRQQAAKKRRRT